MHTDTDERIEADAVSSPPNYPTPTGCSAAPRAGCVPLRPSPSAVVAHIGCRSPDTALPHHNILFGESWEQTFREIIDDGVVMSDPSLLVTRPTAGDPDARARRSGSALRAGACAEPVAGHRRLGEPSATPTPTA